MKIVTAVDMSYDIKLFDIWCFLAGGITGCKDWQKQVIDYLENQPDTDNLVIFNPRRENFPINDPSAAEEQIKWNSFICKGCRYFLCILQKVILINQSVCTN